MNRTELSVNIIAVIWALVNIFLVLAERSINVARTISLGMSLFVMYFVWQNLNEWNIFQRIRKMIFVNALELAATKEADRIINNLKKEAKKEVSNMTEEKITAYCVKCKKKVEIKDGKETKTTKGVRMLKGKCPECNITVCRMLGK